MRKRSGRSGVDHRPWSFLPERSMSVPRDDWCIVGRRSPSAITKGSAFSTTGRKLSPRDFFTPAGPFLHDSRNDGETSTQRTATYVMTQSATSKRAELVFHWLT